MRCLNYKLSDILMPIMSFNR